MTAPDGGVTRESYAEEKGLPVAFLTTLGVETRTSNRRPPAVAIPYRNEWGEVVAIRFRTTEGFRWRKGTEPILYGLDRLAEPEAGKPVILVEGESDAQTLWHAGLPALGVPGASSWRSEWGRYLNGRKVYAWREPDAAGGTFVRKLAADLPDLLVVTPPDGLKDASELYLSDPDPERFRRAVAELLYAARSATEVKVDVPREGDRDGWLVRISDVVPKPVRWMWPRRIPLGKLSLLDGDPGLGKSTITLDLAARLSIGAAMPDGTRPDLDGPAGTVLLTAEDGLDDTVRPRLDVAKADCTRIAVLRYVADKEGAPRWPDVLDVDEIERGIDDMHARLVVVDPLVAYLPGDAHRDQDVRAALADLSALADRRGVAVVAIRHLRKSAAERAIYRGGGSIGLIAAARAGLLVAADPDDPTNERRVLALTKSNLAHPPPSLTYVLHNVQHPTTLARVGCVIWGDESDRTAEQLLAPPGGGGDRTALKEAMDFLQAELEPGPVPSKDLYRRAQQELGISKDTLKRAKAELGVRSIRESVEGGERGAGRWLWVLTDPDPDQGGKG